MKKVKKAKESKLGTEGARERFIFCADVHELEEFKVRCVRMHVRVSERLRWLMRADNMTNGFELERAFAKAENRKVKK